jgi:CheY-like chemotaxis protein
MSRAVKVDDVATIKVSLDRPSILVVDDDDTFLESVQDYFSSIGYETDTANTPEAALQILRKNEEGKYQLIATDLDFGDLSDTRGDQFILNNRALFGDAVTVVITGNWLKAKRGKWLEEAGIYLLEKSPGLFAELEDFAQHAKQKLANDIATIVAKVTESQIEKLTSKHISFSISHGDVPSSTSLPEFATKTLKRTLVAWLEVRSNPDKPAFLYGNNIYSAKQLAEEVSLETDVGKAHILMLLSEFQHFLGINQNDS